MKLPKLALNQLLKERIILYTEIVEHLPLSSDKKKQIRVDYLNFIRLLENRANYHSVVNDITNVSVIILSALIPIMINVTDKTAAGAEDHGSFIFWATVFSVTLAILNGLRQSYKFRERWQNYRETAEQLILEGQSYFALNGKYELFVSHDQAFKKFISSINSIRSKQINSFISQLLSVSDKEVAQSVTAEVAARITDINIAATKANQVKLINDELRAYVKTQPNISYFEADTEKKQVTFFVNNRAFMPADKFSFKSASLAGTVYRVTKEFAPVKTHAQFSISTGIRNKDTKDREFGSAGCICKRTDGTVVFVTCYHVVKHPAQNWDLFIPGDHDEIIDMNNNVVGNIVQAEKTDELDVAIVSLFDSVSYDELLPDRLSVGASPFIDENNLNDYADVYLISRTRNFKRIQGKLAFVNQSVTIDYGTNGESDNKDLGGLLTIHFVSTEPFSQVGDSGSLVFNADGTAIGMIVAGDDIRASFAIPFSTISDAYTLTFL